MIYIFIISLLGFVKIYDKNLLIRNTVYQSHGEMITTKSIPETVSVKSDNTLTMVFVTNAPSISNAIR